MSNENMSNESKKGGILSLPNDNIVKTLVVAIALCLVCSIIVSTAATVLKPRQVANKLEDKKRNILEVAGISTESGSIAELFEQIETKVVDLATGEYDDSVDAVTFDQRKASKDPEYRVDLSKEQDLAQIGGRSKLANVYLVKDGDEIEKIIIPVKGYGLWSTMYGFIALEGDATTTSSVSFYEHAETPGLGGEIENKKWQATWKGKRIVDENGEPRLGLIKGIVDTSNPNAQYQIDGLAGATLTANGVSNLIKFWVGENGFGPYLEKLRAAHNAAQSSTLINQG
jgi:Na+-transporting NADH:ubiquinone oxidoreductase subunit C